jgi:hypothetical protein
MRQTMGAAIAALTIGAALFAAPRTANAGDIQCIWRALPSEAEVAAKIKGNDHFGAVGFSGDQVLAAAATCHVEPKSEAEARALGVSLAGQEMRVIAERLLATRANLNADRLDLAWRAMEPAAKAKLVQDARSLTHQPGAMAEAYQGLLAKLNLPATPNAEIADLLQHYISGRVLLDIYQPQF